MSDETPRYVYPNGSQIYTGGADEPNRLASADYDLLDCYIAELRWSRRRNFRALILGCVVGGVVGVLLIVIIQLLIPLAS